MVNIRRDCIVNHQKHSLLILNLHHPLSLLDAELELTHWHCLHAYNVKQAALIIDNEDICVAIASTDAPNIHAMFQPIEKLNPLKGRIQWVARLSGKTKENLFQKTKDNIAAHLIHYFIDYYYFPIDWHRIADALGHACGIAELKKHANMYIIQEQLTTRLLGNSAGIVKLRRDKKLRRAINKVVTTVDLCLSATKLNDQRLPIDTSSY